jgi:RNA-directed DNA polymerase
MAKAGSEVTQRGTVMPGVPLVNTGVPSEAELYRAQRRVLEIQTKLHLWSGEDVTRRFYDLFNLVADPAFLLVAWERVKSNTGARSAGVDGMSVTAARARVGGELAFLDDIRESLRQRTFRPLPVRERMIPKPGSVKKRRLGIPTVTDRVVQASLKLVLEPIFEAEFMPSSYGFRPGRRAQDAVAEIVYYNTGTRNYTWVLDADIEACFDEIDHTALMGLVRRRIADKRVLALVKAFLKAGILSELGQLRGAKTGTPQGGILSPLLANIALSVLDEHIDRKWGTQVERAKRKRHGLANTVIVRYADDFVVMVDGHRHHVEELREEISGVLAGIGLRLSVEKTSIVHIDEGFDFLGFRIQQRRKRGTSQHYIYTIPSRAAQQRARDRIRELTSRIKHPSFTVLLLRLNSFLRGWSAYFKYGVSSQVFNAIHSYAWRRVAIWLRRQHRLRWTAIRKRYMAGWEFRAPGGLTLFRPQVAGVRYRYRGTRIPTPWTPRPTT